jgi:hypothetical protein
MDLDLSEVPHFVREHDKEWVVPFLTWCREKNFGTTFCFFPSDTDSNFNWFFAEETVLIAVGTTNKDTGHALLVRASGIPKTHHVSESGDTEIILPCNFHLVHNPSSARIVEYRYAIAMWRNSEI